MTYKLGVISYKLGVRSYDQPGFCDNRISLELIGLLCPQPYEMLLL